MKKLDKYSWSEEVLGRSGIFQKDSELEYTGKKHHTFYPSLSLPSLLIADPSFCLQPDFFFFFLPDGCASFDNTPPLGSSLPLGKLCASEHISSYCGAVRLHITLSFHFLLGELGMARWLHAWALVPDKLGYKYWPCCLIAL